MLSPAEKNALRTREFPVTSNLVYFNHAAVGPLPQRTFDAIERQARDCREWGALHWRDWDEAYVRLRRSVASLLGCDSGEISILKNTSEGLSFVANGYRWNDGENVVTTDMEFPSNAAPWKRLETRGVECREIRTVNGTFSPDDVAQAIDERTRIVALSAVAFHNGFRPDLKAIGEICEKRGVLLCVDAIQALGAVKIDVRECRISFLAADGHKWMLAPEGAAVFYCAEQARARLEVLESGWMNLARKGKFIGCPTDLLPDGRRFEAGALNTTGVMALEASLSLIHEIGIERVEMELLSVASELADRLEDSGFEVCTPRPVRSGIVAISPPDTDRSRLRRLLGGGTPELSGSGAVLLAFHTLLEREKIVCAPREGMLRFSPHFYNEVSEIERVVAVLQDLRGGS
ncbi:MAG: aminotransferase class V-fold PLP-dependent enzyme [Thermoanaerobaculia bacterium]